MKRLLYRWFHSFSAFQYRLDRRFTRAGSLALSVLGAAVVIGLDTNRTVGYQIFTLVLALVIISMASSLVFRGRFSAPRGLPRLAAAGVALSHRLTIAHRTSPRPDGPGLIEGRSRPAPALQAVAPAHGP